MFSLDWTPASLAELVRLAGMGILLDEEIKVAITEAGTTIAEAAIANTWTVFENPSGALASTIYPWLASPSQMEIRVDSPYGRRQELGGDDLLDSLGRRMTNPAKPYLQPALDENLDAVQTIVSAAVMHAMSEIGAV